jgi:hypothetical protein
VLSTILTIASVVTGLVSVFGLALFVTERHERHSADGPLMNAPPTHVRVVRKDQRGAIC